MQLYVLIRVSALISYNKGSVVWERGACCRRHGQYVTLIEETIFPNL
jgi:hypothetical protein